MQKNVGDLDAYIRITAGLFMIGTGVIRSSKTMVGFGAMKVAEGVTRFCPMLSLLNLSTVSVDEKFQEIIDKTKNPSYQEYTTEVNSQ